LRTAKPVTPVSRNPRHNRRRITPWNPSEPRPPIFQSKLYEFLQRPASDFSKDSRFLQNPALTAPDWICGDVQAAREIADRVDGLIPLAMSVDKNSWSVRQNNTTIRVVYEDPEDVEKRK
jgi:hypothetical protein